MVQNTVGSSADDADHEAGIDESNPDNFRVEDYLFGRIPLRPLPAGFPPPQPLASTKNRGIHFYLRNEIVELLGGMAAAGETLKQLPLDFFIVKEILFNKRKMDTDKCFDDGSTVTSSHRWVYQVVQRMWMNTELGCALFASFLNLPAVEGSQHGEVEKIDYADYLGNKGLNEKAWCEKLQRAMKRAILPKEEGHQFTLIHFIQPLAKHVLGPFRTMEDVRRVVRILEKNDGAWLSDKDTWNDANTTAVRWGFPLPSNDSKRRNRKSNTKYCDGEFADDEALSEDGECPSAAKKKKSVGTAKGRKKGANVETASQQTGKPARGDAGGNFVSGGPIYGVTHFADGKRPPLFVHKKNVRQQLERDSPLPSAPRRDRTRPAVKFSSTPSSITNNKYLPRAEEVQPLGKDAGIEPEDVNEYDDEDDSYSKHEGDDFESGQNMNYDAPEEEENGQEFTENYGEPPEEESHNEPVRARTGSFEAVFSEVFGPDVQHEGKESTAASVIVETKPVSPKTSPAAAGSGRETSVTSGLNDSNQPLKPFIPADHKPEEKQEEAKPDSVIANHPANKNPELNEESSTNAAQHERQEEQENASFNSGHVGELHDSTASQNFPVGNSPPAYGSATQDNTAIGGVSAEAFARVNLHNNPAARFLTDFSHHQPPAVGSLYDDAGAPASGMPPSQQHMQPPNLSGSQHEQQAPDLLELGRNQGANAHLHHHHQDPFPNSSAATTYPPTPMCQPGPSSAYGVSSSNGMWAAGSTMPDPPPPSRGDLSSALDGAEFWQQLFQYKPKVIDLHQVGDLSSLLPRLQVIAASGSSVPIGGFGLAVTHACDVVHTLAAHLAGGVPPHHGVTGTGGERASVDTDPPRHVEALVRETVVSTIEQINKQGPGAIEAERRRTEFLASRSAVVAAPETLGTIFGHDSVVPAKNLRQLCALEDILLLGREGESQLQIVQRQNNYCQWAVDVMKERERNGDYCSGIRGFLDTIMTWQVLDELSVKHSKKSGETSKDGDFRKCFLEYPVFTEEDATFCSPQAHLEDCRKAYETLSDFLVQFQEIEKMRKECQKNIELYDHLLRNPIDQYIKQHHEFRVHRANGACEMASCFDKLTSLGEAEKRKLKKELRNGGGSGYITGNYCQESLQSIKFGALRSALASARSKRNGKKEAANRKYLMELGKWMKTQHFSRLARSARREHTYSFVPPPDPSSIENEIKNTPKGRSGKKVEEATPGLDEARTAEDDALENDENEEEVEPSADEEDHHLNQNHSSSSVDFRSPGTAHSTPAFRGVSSSAPAASLSGRQPNVSKQSVTPPTPRPNIPGNGGETRRHGGSNRMQLGTSVRRLVKSSSKEEIEVRNPAAVTINPPGRGRGTLSVRGSSNIRGLGGRGNASFRGRIAPTADSKPLATQNGLPNRARDTRTPDRTVIPAHVTNSDNFSPPSYK